MAWERNLGGNAPRRRSAIKSYCSALKTSAGVGTLYQDAGEVNMQVSLEPRKVEIIVGKMHEHSLGCPTRWSSSVGSRIKSADVTVQ